MNIPSFDDHLPGSHGLHRPRPELPTGRFARRIRPSQAILPDLMFALNFMTFITSRGRSPIYSLSGLDDLGLCKMAIRVVSLGYFLALLWSDRVDRGRLRRMLRHAAPLMAYCMLAAMSVAWSRATAFTLYRVFELLVLVLVAFVHASQRDPGEMLRPLYLGALALVGTVAALFVIAPVMVEAEFPKEGYARLGGVMGAMVLGEVSCLLTLCSLCLLLSSGRRSAGSKVCLILSFVVGALVLYGTWSRVPMVVALVCWAAIGWIAYRSSNRFTHKALAYLILCAALVFAMLMSGHVIDWLARGEEASEIATLNNRVNIWGAALRHQPVSRWVVGNGFAAISGDIGIWVPEMGRATMTSHNALLDVWLGLGLAGCLCLCITVWGHCRDLLALRGLLAPPGLAAAVAITLFALLASVTEMGIGGYVGPVLVAFLFVYARLSALACRSPVSMKGAAHGSHDFRRRDGLQRADVPFPSHR